MPRQTLEGPRVAILATDGFEQSELLDPRRALDAAIRNAGGEWVDEEGVVDDNLLTSRKPEDIPAFNREMIEGFGHYHAQRGARER